MITVTNKGRYWFMRKQKLLMLENEDEKDNTKKVYDFILIQKRGKISLTSHTEFSSTEKVVTGRFRLYEVSSEKSFKNGTHLELCIKAGEWNCYVLPEGLPDKNSLEKSFFVNKNCITEVPAA